MVYPRLLGGIVMKTKFLKKPRLFIAANITIRDYGKIQLDEDEMISFITKSKKEYDFTAKDWGFYITPSINSRLKKEGFKIALVKNKLNKTYIMAIDKEKLKIFKRDLKNQKKKVLKWLS